MKTRLAALLCLFLGGLALFIWHPGRLASDRDGGGRLALRRQPQVALPAHTPLPPTPRPAVLPPAARGTAEPLLPLPTATWETAAGESAFSRFAEWTHRYQTAATAADQSALESEGV